MKAGLCEQIGGHHAARAEKGRLAERQQPGEAKKDVKAEAEQAPDQDTVDGRGEKPRRGSTKGATIRPTAVRASTRTGNRLNVRRPGLFAARRAEQPIGPQHEHQCHRHEQHNVGIA